MDKKLLIKVGIGAGVLVLGFLAYKKFVAKPKDTKSAEATPEEEEKVESEEVKSPEVKSPEIFTEWEDDSAEIREKFKKAFGISIEDLKKMQEKSKDISMRQGRQPNRDAARADKEGKLKKFAEENNIDFQGYLKASESYNQHKGKFRDSRKKIVAMGENAAIQALPLKPKKRKATGTMIESNVLASFMDFDGNDDVQGDMM